MTAHRWLITGPVRVNARSTVASGWATTRAAWSGASLGSRASPLGIATMNSEKPLYSSGCARTQVANAPALHMGLDDLADILMPKPARRAGGNQVGPTSVAQVGAHVRPAEGNVFALNEHLTLLRFGHGGIVNDHNLAGTGETQGSHGILAR